MDVQHLLPKHISIKSCPVYCCHSVYGLCNINKIIRLSGVNIDKNAMVLILYGIP